MIPAESRIAASLPWILFGLLLAMCLVVGIVLFLEEPPDSQGYGHPDRGTMRQGGSGERHDRILWWGLALGVLQILFFVACLFFGMRDPSRALRGRGAAFLLGGSLYVAVFTAMIFAYRDHVRDPSAMLLSLPPPTAIMLVGLWTFPLYFVVLYSLKFDDWVFRKEDSDRFEKLVRTRARHKPPEESR